MSTLEALIQAGQALPYAERQKLIEAVRPRRSRWMRGGMPFAKRVAV
jgi:hypothetical protein